LEAATRIIDKDGLDGLTTNRIAQIAGISIGTVYQYFDGKTSIIRALGQREMKAVTDSITSALTASGRGTPPEPARVLVDSVFGAFGGRSKVHRVLLDHALAQGRASGVDDPPNLIAGLLASGGLRRPDGRTLQLSPAQAFVLTYAFTGVTRASMGPQANDLPREELKDALLFLIRSYVDAMAAESALRA
jgi:AcrR family transcriptional regulator